MREKSQAHSESIVLRNVLAGLVLETKLIRLQRQLQAKGWETQPRAPAGQPNGGEWVQGPGGGQWASLHEDRPGGPSPQDPPALTDSTTLEDGTRVLSIRVHAGRKSFDEQHTVTAPDGERRIFETSGATQTILDGQTGDVLSRSIFTATDFVSEPLVQPAFLPAVPLAIEGALAAIQSARTLELALSLLTVLSARKNGFGAVLGLTAHEYALDASSQANMAIWVGPIGQQALDGACPRNGEVRAMTNEVAKTDRASGNYRNATDFGNKVHIEIARRVNLQADQDFKAELLLDPSGHKPNARRPGNVRLDLLENVRASQTVCIYDYKTGNGEISMARAAQLVAAAAKSYPGLRRIIMIQKRPEL
ncbi:hypothetical protein SAMN05192568_1008191 [Methylobacterium pseudosasicola]|uniref:Uncharacterized protein n=2 Tax=Methylobacterium pseudosasicola TaxID=582667 RepID=A0A1I4JRL7_9HYPH|nr:hypothetical protein SAMN05192568_1008191 [Methylobacterium pseudosasicola]